MADVPAALTGLGALLVAVLGAATPAVAAAPVVTAPADLVARVGSPTTIAGASVSGFGAEPLRLVVSVTSGVLELPATTLDVTIPAGYPALGVAGPQLAIEGEEPAVNAALADLSWTPEAPGPAEVTIDVSPAGAAYEPDGAHFYQLVTAPAPIAWGAARDAAAAMTFNELAGSLAAITTDAEQALLARIAPVDAWVGATDLAAPVGVRWLSAPDQTASVVNYIVEYTDAPVDDGTSVGRAIGVLHAAVPPSAPVLGDVRAGVAEATVHWQPPLADSGAPVLGYVVSGDPGGWCSVPATQTSCVLRGLVGGAAHTFRVVAINEVGLGVWSDPSGPVTPTEPDAPDAPAEPAEPVPPVEPPVDTVDTTVQPFPGDVVIIGPVGETATPAGTAAGDTEPAPGSGDGAAAPAATTGPRPRATTTTSTTVGATTALDTTALDTPALDGATLEASPAPPTGGADTPLTAEAASATPATAGAPTLTVVFAVGPGASLGDARFTVRGKHLSPGTVVTVVAHSEPVVIGTTEVAADGTLVWIGALPADLADGDHSLIATGVGHDGSKVERTMAFTAESGHLVRIGASALETIAPAVPTTAAGQPEVAEPVADAAASSSSASENGSSSGGLPRRAILLVLALGAGAWLVRRARARRASGASTGHAAPGDAAAAPASTALAAAPGSRRSSRRHVTTAGARRRSRRQPAGSL